MEKKYEKKEAKYATAEVKTLCFKRAHNNNSLSLSGSGLFALNFAESRISNVHVQDSRDTVNKKLYFSSYLKTINISFTV